MHEKLKLCRSRFKVNFESDKVLRIGDLRNQKQFKTKSCQVKLLFLKMQQAEPGALNRLPLVTSPFSEHLLTDSTEKVATEQPLKSSRGASERGTNPNSKQKSGEPLVVRLKNKTAVAIDPTQKKAKPQDQRQKSQLQGSRKSESQFT